MRRSPRPPARAPERATQPLHLTAVPRSRPPWALLAWLLIPSALAIGLAVFAMAPGDAVFGRVIPVAGALRRPTVAAPVAQAAAVTPAAQLPAATSMPARPPPPAPSPANTVSAVTTDLPTWAAPTQLPAALPTLTATAPATGGIAGNGGVPPLATDPPDPTPWPSLPTVSPLPPTPRPPPAPTATPAGPSDPITGLPADPAKLARVPLTVMIDNHPDAAPQTGLNAASLVIEALAEGGITRFEAFYLSGDAPTVGPVRSARPYFVEWAYPFKPVYVHCGGSVEAVDLIAEASGLLTNADCFDGNMPFWRSSDRLMPHNLYSSTTDLWQMASRLGLRAPATEPAFLHSLPLPAEQRPAAASVSFVFSSLSRSDVTWVYDRSTNRYLRQQWGAWHRDLATGDIVSAADVVILWTNVWELPGDEKGRMGTDTTGHASALILRDGQFEWGSWSRKTPSDALTIADGKGQPMRFVPGRVWIEVLGLGHRATIGH